MYRECRLYFFLKASQRLLLKSGNERGLGLCQNVLERVYSSLVESILTFNITVCYGNLRVAKHTGKILEENLVQSCFGGEFTFQQDNNITYKGKSTLELLTENKGNVPELLTYS